MCGRFAISSPADVVSRRFGVRVSDNFPPRYNVAPTQPIAVIRQDVNHSREYALVRWGFIPSWAKGEQLQRAAARPLINARGETVAEKPTFRSAYKRRRCLVPANGFYEWRTEQGRKQPYLVQHDDGELIAFAALWETALDPDGGEIDTAAIITTAAGPDIASLHNREPVVITPDAYGRWLEGDERDMKFIAPLIRAQPKGYWAYEKVSTAVNNVRNDGPDLLRPFGQAQLDF
ncbi:MAG: SOS response-associated peptidase [Parvularculaceae bacterium]|nr:SOS response-associated peptidase [Parvularculaceae bacterium]